MSDPEDRLARLLPLYRTIVRLRAFEEVVAIAAREGHVEGLLHLAIGGEAVTAALFDRLGEEDRAYVAHRPHQQFLAGGADPRAVMAELAGRETGLCRGRGGSLHLMAEQVVMATGIVGGTLSIAVGHALRMPPGAVVVVVFGDGAVQTGAFHESLNLAALWKVPVLFVCENNGWIEFSSREEHTTVRSVSDYGGLYGIPTRQANGSDVESVGATVAELLEILRGGGGPALLEVATTRIRPHYEGDFRDRPDEVDFLPQLQARLAELGASEDEVQHQLEDEMAAMREVLADVLREPWPDPADDAGLVFARTVP